MKKPQTVDENPQTTSMGLLLNKNSFGTGIDGAPSSPSKMAIVTPAEMSPKHQPEFSL